MDEATKGWTSGLLGVVIFSATLPATRVAVMDFDPVFLTVARASIAGALALVALLLFGRARPARGDLPALLVVALGVVAGFPLLTAIALTKTSSAHLIVFLGLLPLATAIFGVVRGGERPRPAFWAFSGLGAALVAGFAASQGGTASLEGDLLMLVAVVICGLGYAEGASLSRRLGGWRVICWALVVALPVSIALTLALMPASFAAVGGPAWAGLAYVSLFSMLIGFVFWYQGLALGGVAAVSQLQLLQPLFGLAVAAALLNETVCPAMIAVTAAVVLCVAGARRHARPIAVTKV